MLLNTRRTAANLLSLPPTWSKSGALRVATAFIEEDGGKLNVGAKIFATLWYLLILPDSNSRLRRQLHRKRLPWYAPSRLVGLAVSAANVVSMPLSWGLLIAGKRNASRLASLGVLANPPSLTISVLLATEIASQIMKLSANFTASTCRLLAKPILLIMPSQQGGAGQGGETAAEPGTGTGTGTNENTSASTTQSTSANKPTSGATTTGSSTSSSSYTTANTATDTPAPTTNGTATTPTPTPATTDKPAEKAPTATP